MRRLLTLIIAILASLTVTAQVEHSIILDQSTFRKVQTDALTGVNIDPIRRDISRNACARLKIRFANMSRAEVDALEIKFRSNTDLARQSVAQYYDNVLILEMTAKANTRFYVQSPDFGQSNEVMLNLESDVEYEMEARLNQIFSIIVNSNVVGAEVYVDSRLKGRTAENCSLTISEVAVGEHTLKISYGGMSTEQRIVVNKNSISFSQNVNTVASKPQYVVFAVEPKTAVVIIDNKHYTLQDGLMQVVLENGSYNYTVAAAGYHSASGTVVVEGKKVERSVTLIADSATVTLTAPDNAEIWVNGVKKGVGTWSGSLNSGTYIFEARKAGYVSSSISQTISSVSVNQSYTLPALVPIVGSIDIVSNPIMADITLDGKVVGRTPLTLENQLVGSHTLKISKAGYGDYTKTIKVVEGETTSVSVTLPKSSEAVSPTAQSQQITVDPSELTFAPYKVGDYYNDGTRRGVVVEVNSSGRSGMLVSLTESPDASYSELQDWCRRLGSGWRMPYIDELKLFAVKGSALDSVNATLKQYGVVISDKKYESLSTEYKSINHIGDSDSYRVFHYYVSGNSACNTCHRRGQGPSSSSASVRAVCNFEAPYRVGEYYNQNGKQGVIFELSADGKHGKILSMTQDYVKWAEQGSESKRNIKATNRTDGESNMSRVKSRAGWKSKYPAFKWCAELGEGWYLPAIDELKLFLLDDYLYKVVNRALRCHGGELLKDRGYRSGYWSSTESNYMFEDECSAYSVNMENAKVTSPLKYISLYARAVSKF